MPRNAPDRWDREHENQLQEHQRAEAAGMPIKRAKTITMGTSWTARVSHSVASAAGAFVPSTAAKHGPFGARDGDEEDEIDAAQKQKARALKEEQTTTSTVEQHYYHMHEVWHCLYNRTETSHLRDPDNDEFKNEEARKRQISLFESLMQTSQVELYQSVNADIDNECCARVQVRISRTRLACILASNEACWIVAPWCTQPMQKASIGSINLVHAEASRVIQREARAYIQRKAKQNVFGGGARGAKGMHDQALKSMKNGAYEDAAKHLFSAYSLEANDRKKREEEFIELRQQEKMLREKVAEFEARLERARRQNVGSAANATAAGRRTPDDVA